MAASHQSGVILHHWNDPPSTTFTKNKSASSSTVSLGLPTPPVTPSPQTNESLARGIESLLNVPTTLVGRNKDMIFTRVRGLIKSIDERKIPDSQFVALEEILGLVQDGKKALTRDRIVRLMSEEQGVGAWGTALRMVVENTIS